MHCAKDKMRCKMCTKRIWFWQVKHQEAHVDCLVSETQHQANYYDIQVQGLISLAKQGRYSKKMASSVMQTQALHSDAILKKWKLREISDRRNTKIINRGIIGTAALLSFWHGYKIYALIQDIISGVDTLQNLMILSLYFAITGFWGVFTWAAFNRLKELKLADQQDILKELEK